MRIILKKHKTLKHSIREQRTFDPLASQNFSAKTGSGAMASADRNAEKRKRVLAQPIPGNRARVEGGVGTYTVAPVNNLSNAVGADNRRKLGASGEDAFRKIAQRGTVPVNKR